MSRIISIYIIRTTFIELYLIFIIYIIYKKIITFLSYSDHDRKYPTYVLEL